MRTIGVDLGSRWIGIAVSDSAGTVATPREVLERSGDLAVDHARIAALVAEVGAEEVVVGLPLTMSGHRGPAAEAAELEASSLANVLEVPVRTHDERLTTATAARVAEKRPARFAGRSGGDRHSSKYRLDAAAAAILLQSWLDSRR